MRAIELLQHTLWKTSSESVSFTNLPLFLHTLYATHERHLQTLRWIKV